MQFKIITETENPLFGRKEIEGEIHADVTPNREEVAKIISEKFSTNTETIKIRTIKGKFGQKVFLIVANIYNSKEDKDKIENKKKKDIEIEKKQQEAKKPVEQKPEENEQINEERKNIQENKKEISKEVSIKQEEVKDENRNDT